MLSKKVASLKRSSDFLNLKQSGNKFLASHWLLISYKSNQNLGFRAGIVVSRKIGSAVLRNKLKRWVREKTRNYVKNSKLENMDVSFVFLPSKSEFFPSLTFEKFSSVVDKSFQKMERLA